MANHKTQKKTGNANPAPIYRKEPKSSSGYNRGDIDTVFCLFRYGLVGDGFLPSTSSRDHLVEQGYAVRYQDVQALTGKGVVALIRQPRTYITILKRLWHHGNMGLTIDDPTRCLP